MSIFEEQRCRKPDHYPWAQKFIDAMHNGFWTSKEFSFKSDIQQFKVDLNEQEQEIIIRTLSAIAQIEVAVKTFWARLGDNLPHPSLTDLGYVMANVEVIHNSAYEKLLEVLDMEHVFEENLKLDFMQGRITYLRKYTHRCYENDKKQYVYALILFTLFVENVSLFSQFYIINWFNRYKNVLKDTAQQIAYTAKEELIHGMVGMKLVNVIREEHPELFDEDLEGRVLHEAIEAFKAESNIINWMVNGIEEEELNAPILKEFVKNRINESLAEIKFPKVFDVDQSLIEKTTWFDEDVLGNIHTDFFEKKPVEYAKSNKSYSEADLF